MSVNLNPGHLRYEMVRRGWDAIDLARASRLSPATVSTALAGRPIAAKSVVLIAKALAGAPVDDLIDKLVSDSPGLGFA
jgi:transcriptional regulator with XRE-family HTH domain